MVQGRVVERLLPVAERIEYLFPTLERTIAQARMETDAVTHLAESLFRGLNAGLGLAVALLVMGIGAGDAFLMQLAVVAGPVGFGFGFFTFAKLPEIRAKRRVRKLEKELPYALRHILIEVDSGISLYQAMVAVSDDYGEASEEFRTIVKDINAGVSEIEALEQAVLRNPSLQFRRSLWQMINALKSGSDISQTLESLVDAIMEQQILEVQKYGKSLNPFTLMYLMIAVILPSLGVTFLMVLSTFTGMSVPNTIFYMILAGLVLFQLLFINIIKSKRPEVKT